MSSVAEEVEVLRGSRSATFKDLLTHRAFARLVRRDVEALHARAFPGRAGVVTEVATAAAKTGNDPHNQELGSCLLEDYAHSTARDRDRLLLAQAKHTGGHRKYGDHLEAYRRFSEAFGLADRR